jgi:hypothetical protein
LISKPPASWLVAQPLILGRYYKLIAEIALAVAMALWSIPASFPLTGDARAGDRSGNSLEGERLVFHVEWNPPWYLFFLPPMDAGEVEIRLTPETLYEDKSVLKISFKARSSGTLAKLTGVGIDDQYEFYTDSSTLCTYGVFKKIRQGKRQRDSELHYSPDSHRLHYRELDVATSPHTLKKDEYIDEIPPCVRDPFSALYAFKRETLSIGLEVRMLVGNDNRVKNVVAHVEKREIADISSRKYDSWKVETVAILGGLFKDGGQFHLWLTADERKTPVQFEARVSLGKVVGRLSARESIPARPGQE